MYMDVCVFVVEELKSMHCKAISDLQVTMAKQEAIVEVKGDEIDVLTAHLSKKVAQLDDISAEFKKTKEELLSLQRRIAEGSDLVR